MSKQTIFKALPAIILSSLLTVAIIYAWREPTQAPPGGNVPAPINVGGTTQFKSGALGIGGVFRGYSTAIFDGHVGIGTTSPRAKLNVESSVITGSGSENILKINVVGNNIFSTATGYIGFRVWDASNSSGIDDAARIAVTRVADGGHPSRGGAHLSFWTTPSGITNPTVQERVRITNDGNLGIGTTGPNSRLHIHSPTITVGTQTSILTLRGNVQHAGGGEGIIQYEQNDVGNGVLSTDAAKIVFAHEKGTGVQGGIGMAFYTSAIGSATSAERVRITNTGNVGIGTTRPTSLLHLASASSIDLNMFSTAVGGYSRLFLEQERMAIGGSIGMRGDATHAGGFSIEGDSTGLGNWGSRLFINLAGNVGIGTTAPATRLHVEGTVRMTGFQLGTTATAGHVLTTDASGVGTWQPAAAGVTWPLLSTIDGTVSAPAYSWRDNPNMGIRRGGINDLRFVTAGADRLTIDSAGNVGIGSTSPRMRLDVRGNAIFGTGTSNLELIQSGQVFEIRHHDPGIAWRDISLNPHGGNVGIGTMRPNSRLEVAGTIHSTTGGFRFPDGTTQTTAAAAHAAHGKQLFTSSGTFHVPPGVTRVWVSLAGGGGGGGGGTGGMYAAGSGGGGGGGAHAVMAIPLTVTPGAVIPVTIGAGGHGGAPGGAGGIGGVGANGGTTTFGNLISAPGGAGGHGGAPGGAGGAGGAAGNVGVGSIGGVGGGSIFGAGAAGGGFGGGFGAGGGGGWGTIGTEGGPGGAGSPGFVLVEW